MNTPQAQPMILDLIVIAKTLLLPCMMAAFGASLLLRALIYWTIKREEAFSIEFDKRVQKFLETDPHQESRSFFVTTKKLLEKTFYEMFIIRGIMLRRKSDYIMAPT